MLWRLKKFKSFYRKKTGRKKFFRKAKLIIERSLVGMTLSTRHKLSRRIGKYKQELFSNQTKIIGPPRNKFISFSFQSIKRIRFFSSRKVEETVISEKWKITSEQITENNKQYFSLFTVSYSMVTKEYSRAFWEDLFCSYFASSPKPG